MTATVNRSDVPFLTTHCLRSRLFASAKIESCISEKFRSEGRNVNEIEEDYHTHPTFDVAPRAHDCSSLAGSECDETIRRTGHNHQTEPNWHHHARRTGGQHRHREWT